MSSLPSGARIGPYQVVSALGAGGMGEVYRARDERLGREVAIKILPAVFASDPERIARFQREARTLATLAHPNIAGIHGIEDLHGSAALVMELVDGEDLAARLARGAIPLEEALPIARQVADALELAHQQGIIHRDLKPANIKVRTDGAVKLLDFGLAKILEPAESGTMGMEGPTITSAELTHAGVVLGTAAYMSPEQARGKPVDKRTDVWAFGCMLFELLTGQRAFAGEHRTDVLSAILTSEPQFALLPVATPAAIRRLLRRCLQKNPNERLRDMGDARLEIREAESPAGEAQGLVVTESTGRRNEWLAWVMVGMLALALAVLLVRPNQAPAEIRVNIVTPPSPSPASVAISPDGRTIVFVGSSDADTYLWLRPLHADAPRPLEGTEGAEAPFWSPDSRSIGFFAGGKLKRVDLDGGSVQTLANATTGTDGTWGRHGDILFASRGNPILRVSASEGGEPSVVAGIAPGSNFSPVFLPDGRRFLYYRRGSAEIRGVYAGDLNGPVDARRLVDSEAGAVYVASGYLLFILRSTLLAQAFDPDRLAVAGDPFPVAQHLAGRRGFFGPTASVSSSGSIAYRGDPSDGHRQFVWFDRSGAELSRLGTPSETLSLPSLTRDGERVVFYRGLDGNVDLWTMDTRRGAPDRITSDPRDDVSPAWSPDGSRVAFSSNRSGTLDLYVRQLNGGGGDELVLSNSAFKTPTDWSNDGRYLLFTTEGAKRSLDIWALPVEGDLKPFPVVQSADFAEQAGQFSPDGRWIAFQSDESGRPEIYLQPFPGPGAKVTISTTGGSQVRWRSNGEELFYVARNGDLMAVPIQLPPGGRTLQIGTPVRLFAPPIGRAMQLGDARHQYVVSADGERVLVATVTEPPTAPISLILNWKARPE